MSSSETIMSNKVHAGDSTSTVVTGTKFKGDGYYGRADGFHTVQYNVAGFNGTIKMQGTLATDPAEADYFDIAGTESNGTEGSYFYNFINGMFFITWIYSFWRIATKKLFIKFQGPFFF